MIRVEVVATYPAPIQVVFDEHRNVELHIRSQAHHQERAVDGVTSGLLNFGDEVEWEAVHFGVRQRLRARITEMSAPHSFSDEQLSGAFKSLVHHHRFRNINDSTTEAKDMLVLAAPFGPLGWIAERLFLGGYMRRLLEDKAKAMGGTVTTATTSTPTE